MVSAAIQRRACSGGGGSKSGWQGTQHLASIAAQPAGQGWFPQVQNMIKALFLDCSQGWQERSAQWLPDAEPQANECTSQLVLRQELFVGGKGNPYGYLCMCRQLSTWASTPQWLVAGGGKSSSSREVGQWQMQLAICIASFTLSHLFCPACAHVCTPHVLRSLFGITVTI